MNLKRVLIDFGDTLAYFDEETNREYEAAILSTTRKYGYLGGLGELSSSLSRLYWRSNRGEIPDFQSFFLACSLIMWTPRGTRQNPLDPRRSEESGY